MKDALKIAVILFLCTASCTAPEQEDITVYMVGDSTMAKKKDPEHNPERGWGMAFPRVFNSHVTVADYAINGRSSKSYIDEGRWDTVVAQLKPGDYVIIQFGHNDSKTADPSRYTNPYSAYRRNLVRYVKDTREKGAYPVLCSPIVRRYFNEFGTLVDTHGAYPLVARLVAQQYKVPFLDLQQKTEDWVTGLGPEKSKKYFMNLEPGECDLFPDGRTDNTHLQEAGAYAVSVFAAEELADQDVPLAKYLKKGLLTE